MCDENFEHDLENYARFPRLTRRQFGAASVGAGLMLTLPRAADAQAVTEQDVNVTTPDGTADCYFVHPASGAHAGVIVWPDILGLRPAFRQMGKRLAESGYSVLVVNPFYRKAKAPVVPAGASFADQKTRDTVMPLAQSLNPTTHMTDARAFVAWLDGQASVDRNRKIGTTGYCMGGPIVMRTAAAVSDRVGAGGSFHGGGLVTKDADSPHLLVPKMKASFLFCVAENDDQRDPTAKDVLKETFAKAKLPAEIEVYAGAAHGWCPPDSAVYNEKQAERAWSRLLVLFKSALA
ncbi:MAG: dienelactone hydrolase family protein [Vicinamibacterales bacterium]